MVFDWDNEWRRCRGPRVLTAAHAGREARAKSHPNERPKTQRHAPSGVVPWIPRSDPELARVDRTPIEESRLRRADSM
uniref:Uncharacterized protein n=1 Tax=uncultured bacterium F42-01 TaxID=1191438 RepID=I3VII8_9BACT|nr:hypothetical protein [uncultured bacterium F42-01]